MSTPPLDRKAMRQRLIAEREALPAAQRQQWTAALLGPLGDLLAQLNPLTLGFCWPFRGEPDLREFLAHWRTQAPGRVLALPIVPETPGPLAFHAWQPGDAMVTDRFGIPAPQGTPEAVPEVVLVPVNGFDACGYRLGYGGGFFDRTLAALRPAPRTVGVGFELARLADVQPASHDRPLDWIVTEAGVVVRPARAG